MLRLAALSLAAMVPAVVPPAQGADPGRTIEYGIKAAYLYNFTKFVDWPESAFADATSPFLIGVLDRDGTARRVVSDAFINKVTNTGRRIVVRAFSGVTPDLVDCQMVFVAGSAADDLAAVRALCGTRPILLTGESDQFAQRGGIINLVTVRDAVRCEINLRRAQQAGLMLSGRLASVARLVRDVEVE